ncbi:hypothetical protein, partial [Pseudomonas syringae group genomosp. 7]|uniref:hypothetical protein n=1 Tax=Pseudomonas syringae group genomosp. 7 TaxID=251699 RepID=UPI00376FC081
MWFWFLCRIGGWMIWGCGGAFLGLWWGWLGLLGCWVSLLLGLLVLLCCCLFVVVFGLAGFWPALVFSDVAAGFAQVRFGNRRDREYGGFILV